MTRSRSRRRRAAAQVLAPGLDPLTAVLRAVAAFERAVEYRRASAVGEQRRLNRAGTDYAVKKFRLFRNRRCRA